MEDYDIPGRGARSRHFYRAMAWLREELEEEPDGRWRRAASRT